MTGVRLPERARVVIIGGGVIGASVAYHLALEGITDVLLLERDRLTSGTTWHAAGLMTTFGSFSSTETEIRLYSRELFARLPAETGVETGFRPVGLIEAAADADRLEQYRRTAVFQRRLGLACEEISPAEMSELFPFADMTGLLAGFFVPGDGRVNPVDLTMSLTRGARRQGVRIIEGVPVEQVLTRQGRHVETVTGVRTATGDIECETVVNCAGMWARQLGERNGVVIPNQAAEHYYLITDTIDGLRPDHPVFEDPASHGYYREEGGGMMVGLFEPRAAAWRPEGVADDFSFGTIPFDMDRMAPFVETALARVPVTHGVGIRTLFCGPESFTPDLRPAVGEAPGIRGYFVCAGLNSVGILSSGGWGRIMAHWIATGEPGADVTGFTVDRFQPWQNDRHHREARTAEILGQVYAAHPPGTQLTTSRGVHVSPVHDRLAAHGAYFRDVSGWEGADWFAGAGRTPSAVPGWGRQPWWEHWRAEHTATRQRVGLIDMSFMGKLEVRGPDAAAVLERLSTATVASEPGRITYTQWLDGRGHIEADLTVTMRGEGDFLVISSDTMHGHTQALLRRALPEGAQVTVEDVTTDLALLCLQGPRSRDTLAAATADDVSAAAIRFRDSRCIDVAGRQVRASRMSYVGELGFELLVPRESAGVVYDALLDAGRAHGIVPVGLKAVGSLRLEKGYRDLGHDVDNTDTPMTAGLDWVARFEKPGGFIGDDAARAEAGRGAPQSRLVSIVLEEPEPVLHEGEVLLRDGRPVGDVRAASYGWTVGAAVGLAFVECDAPVTSSWLAGGRWEVDSAGRRYAARVSLSAPL
jgi:glycine cleavage system aminomethyltransferase T/glycine/D-amino acid oxidase-like deaminating enzyme